MAKDLLGFQESIFSKLPEGEAREHPLYGRWPAVFIGVATPWVILLSNRMLEADTLETAVEIFFDSSTAFWIVIAILFIAALAISGFVAESHPKQSYGNLIKIGLVWGSAFTVLILTLPILRILFENLGKWLLMEGG